MPTVHIEGRRIECSRGDLLTDVLERNGLSPHNGLTKWFNCHGAGTCGTCAVEVQGLVSPPSLVERLRLFIPPFSSGRGLRLACKTKVLGDVHVRKNKGLWGHRVPTEPLGPLT